MTELFSIGPELGEKFFHEGGHHHRKSAAGAHLDAFHVRLIATQAAKLFEEGAARRPCVGGGG